MRLSALFVGLFLLVSPVLFAQHSGGASSSGSSAGTFSSSGASHSSYSGGSSPGASAPSSRSTGSSSGTRSSGGSASRTSRAGLLVQTQKHTPRQGQDVEPINRSRPEHRTFLGFLRNPFRMRGAKAAEAALRRPPCKDKSCSCLAGRNRGCAVTVTTNNHQSRCHPGEYWDGGVCSRASLFLPDDCGSLALALDRESRQSRLTEGLRQSSCCRDAAAQECSDLTGTSHDETARYQSLLQQYRQCKRQRVDGWRARAGIN
jgi:hypothetical protein